MSEHESFVSPAAAVAQCALAMAAAYTFGRAKGYEDDAVLFLLAAALVGAGGGLAYYARVSVLGRFVSPGEPRQGAAARLIEWTCLALMGAGVALLLWTVLAIGRHSG